MTARAVGSHVVQVGAFRDDGNAAEMLHRLQRRGEVPFTATASNLTVVYVGPFPTREGAVTAGERLRDAGFDVYVTRR